MENKLSIKFTTISLIKYAFPSLIMMLFLACYTVVDGFFISRLAGSIALSATNIVFPVISILLAVGVMFATGGSAVVAKEMGMDENERANSHFTLITIFALIISVIIMIVTLVFLDDICYALGSSEELLPYCKDYLRFYIYFAPACMLQCLFQSFFVTAGKPNLGLAVTIFAGIFNAIMDYVFMALLNFGVGGAAIATGIGQLFIALVGVVYFTFSKKGLRFTKFKFDFKVIGRACFNGSSEMVTNISTAIITFAFNIVIMKLAGADGIAAITILLYAQFLFNAVYSGFSMGVAPIISYKFGANDNGQLKSVYKISRGFVAITSVIVTIASFILAKNIVGFFVPIGTQVFNLAVEGFNIFAIGFFFSGFNIFCSSVFTALSDGKTSAILSFGRTFIFILAALLILPRVFGINGVWVAIPVAEFITVFMSVAFNKKLTFLKSI